MSLYHEGPCGHRFEIGVKCPQCKHEANEKVLTELRAQFAAVTEECALAQSNYEREMNARVVRADELTELRSQLAQGKQLWDADNVALKKAWDENAKLREALATIYPGLPSYGCLDGGGNDARLIADEALKSSRNVNEPELSQAIDKPYSIHCGGCQQHWPNLEGWYDHQCSAKSQNDDGAKP